MTNGNDKVMTTAGVGGSHINLTKREYFAIMIL